MDKNTLALMTLVITNFNSVADADYNLYARIEGGYSQAAKFRNYNKNEELQADLVDGSNAEINYKSSKSGIIGVALGYKFNPFFSADLSLHNMHYKFSGIYHAKSSNNNEEAIV